MINSEIGPRGLEQEPERNLDQGSSAEKPDWKKKIEEESGEPYEVSSARSVLEVVEEGVKKGYITSPENVAILKQQIEEARSKGIDLSSIDGLDKRVEQLKQEAPRVAMQSCLEKIKDLGGDEKNELARRSWYYFAQELINDNEGSFKPEEVLRIRKRLDKVKIELGLD